jgi:hypothetical protein
LHLHYEQTNNQYQLKNVYKGQWFAGKVSDSYIIIDNLVDLEVDVEPTPTILALDRERANFYIL